MHWTTIAKARFFAILTLAFLSLAMCVDAAPPSKTKEEEMSANWARDPKIAVKEEFDAAMKDGSCEALELFLARHPEDDNEFAPEALKALESKKCVKKKG